MLNKTLYEALGCDGAEVLVKHENAPAGYRLPDKPDAVKAPRLIPGAPVYGKLERRQWGEIYNRSCPVCGDTGKHLFMCHALGAKVVDKTTDKTVSFSKYSGYVCHRRHCDLTAWLRGLNLPDDVFLKESVMCVGEAGDMFTSLRKSGLATLPEPNYDLMDKRTPEGVRSYLVGRGLDPSVLSEAYDCRYSPPNAVYEYTTQEGEKKVEKIFEGRLVIPVIMHERLQTWQARRIFPNEKYGNKYKYIFPPIPKSDFIYNFDNAMMHQDVGIFEGVMKVYHLGDDCMATFGKSVSDAVAELLKVVFDYDGRFVVCYDPDCYAKGDDLAAARTLLKHGSFKRGGAVLRLRGTKQPEDRDRDEIRAMMLEAWQHAVTTPEALETQGVYNEPEPDGLEAMADTYRELKILEACEPTEIEQDLAKDKEYEQENEEGAGYWEED